MQIFVINMDKDIDKLKKIKKSAAIKDTKKWQKIFRQLFARKYGLEVNV